MTIFALIVSLSLILILFSDTTLAETVTETDPDGAITAIRYIPDGTA